MCSSDLRTTRPVRSWFVPSAIVLTALISAAPWLSAQAPQSLRPNQVATFSLHPSSSGTITVTLPQIIQQHATLIVGVTFSPADITGVTVGEVGGGPGNVETLTRGLQTSIAHSGPGGPFFTNFYYGTNHGLQLAGLGAGTVTLNFSGGATYALIAVAEVSGLACLDCAPLDQSAYNESLSPTASWSSGAATTTAFNEYLFSWGATEASDSTCSSPGNGWTLESQTDDPSGAAVCLLDQFVAAPGFSYTASVNASPAAIYGMELVTFAKQIAGTPPAVTSANPSFGAQGQSLPAIVIAGSSFDSSVVCSFGAGITVNSCAPNSSTQLVANITIDATAAVGPRNVTVTAPGNNLGGTLANAFSVTSGGSAPDFTINTATPSQASLDGGTAIYSVVLKESNGFKQPVTLSCSALPAGMTCSAPPPVTPTASGATAAITVNVPAALAASTNAHSFTITGTSGSLSHSVPAQLFVATLNGTIAPSAPTIPVGGSANFTVSLTATDGFTGPVSLNCAGLAAGLRCVYPSPFAVPGSATLAVFVDAKPISSSIHTGPPDLRPDARGIALAVLLFLLLLAMAIYRRGDISPAGMARGFAALALVLVLAIGLVSCGGATKSGALSTTSAATGTGGSGSSGGTSGNGGMGGTGGTGGGSSITSQFAVQAQSAGASVNLGTVSITVP